MALSVIQQRDYFRALERALINKVRVHSSRTHSDGVRTWTVVNGTNGHYHTVTQHGRGYLECSCPATSYCQHRAVTRAYEIAKRDRARAQDEARRLPVLTTVAGREAVAAEALAERRARDDRAFLTANPQYPFIAEERAAS